MPKNNYSDKLTDPRWQRKRLEILNRDNFTCTLCTDDRTTLHVHHNEYKGDPWQIASEHLKTVCLHCHSIIHALPDYNITAVHKKLSLNAKCWVVVAFYENGYVFLYMFITTDKTEIITVFPEHINQAA